MPDDGELNLSQNNGTGAENGGSGAGAGGVVDNAGGNGADGTPDWREQFIPKDIEGRDKLVQGLTKFKTPVDLAKSYGALQAKLSQGGVRVPGANATPDELSAYQKAIGVPEAADGYKLNRPQGVPEAKDAEAAFAQAAHKAGLSQAQLDGVLGYYWGLQRSAAEAASAQEQEATQKIEAAREATGKALDETWGYSKENNLARIDAFLSPFMPKGEEGEASNFLQIKLPDGSLLGDNLPLIRALDKAARASLGDGRFVTSDGGSKALDDELAQIEGLRRSDPAKYKTPDVQDRLMKLMSAKLGV
jgi:hypothetical protein